MAEMFSRRSFLRGVGYLVGIAAFGLALPESRGLDREANRNELAEFLNRQIENPEVLGPYTANFLNHLRLSQPSEVRWAHNADSKKKINAFVLDQERHVAELDCRFDERRGIYVSHKRDGKSDINPGEAYNLVATAQHPKVLKYDFKDAEAARNLIDSIDTSMPCVINADLFDNHRFGMSPQQFVDMSERLPNALISIGRKTDSGSIDDFVDQFIQLAADNPDKEFIMPAHIIDFLNNITELRRVLDVPNISLMIYRTSDYKLTQGHLNWIKKHFDDQLRSRTFFDL